MAHGTPLTANKLYVLNKPNNKPNLPRNARTRYKQITQGALTHSYIVLGLVSFWKENKFKAHLQHKVIIFERTVQGFSLEAGT